jgi:Hemerythrin HHE cation binding domain
MQNISNTNKLDALSLLRRDHAVIKQLFHDYGQLLAHKSDHARELIVAQICLVLSVHMQIQEEILYPVLKSTSSFNTLIAHALLDHKGVRELIAKLGKMKPVDHNYDATVAVLREYVTPYFHSDQEEIFAKIDSIGLNTEALSWLMVQRQKVLYDDMNYGASIALTAHLPPKPFPQDSLAA